ncbi:Pimeloyl-ACP methyl ester carboxylesterase [Paracidovorax valerianellae]|uniref:Pimeloyl-ACP methyl ester carboxylesterase n=1 Tax=Paracidovorax valerianellae TaxID=187868 RepID=A0A1G6M721_9BURK|nr:alpha/beta hydrolase [Paracidovorax valerianellae]MDA8446076.1 alpha/beta hydrolase [Paracidovorax valerianellae]SDC51147.1 Pimeloyl-ACP methyl ester carboxylesterase [Paracidovorax valerianellae]
MELLRRKGYHVTAVQNPLTSLADDVKATRRVLARQIGPVLLVGHSWAGAVITEAGNQPNVRGLVYVSAFAPDSGESVAELLKRLNSPMEGLYPDSEGLLWLDDPVVYANVMAGDVPAKKVQSLAAAQQPMAANAFTERVSQAAWREKPSWYLVTNNDRALPSHVQRRLASEIQAETKSIDSSHMSMVSQPRLVADLSSTRLDWIDGECGPCIF